MEMTAEYLKAYCKEERSKKNDIYSTPELNDKLYLHYKGFRKIQNLEPFTSLKVIWLEGNGLEEISGLEKNTMMRTLYLHENCIHDMKGLGTLTDLNTLNLSKNFVTTIAGLENCQKLETLMLAHNHLAMADDVRHVLQVPSIVSVDLQHCRIEDPSVIEIFAQMPNLRVLYLMGNPVVKQIRYYRKTVVASCPNLRYLDDRPVFEDERRRVNRWKAAYDETGNYEAANEAERDEIVVIREEKRQAEERNFRAFDAMVKEGIRTREEREARVAATRAAYGDTAAGEDGEETKGCEDGMPPSGAFTNDGMPITLRPEQPALKAAREARLAKVMGTGGEAEEEEEKQGLAATGGGFFAAGATPDGPDDARADREAKAARESEAQEKIAALLSQDIWPELAEEEGAAPPPLTLAPAPPLPPAPMPPPPPPAAVAAATSSPVAMSPPRPPPSAPPALPHPPPPPAASFGGNTDFDELD